MRRALLGWFLLALAVPGAARAAPTGRLLVLLRPGQQAPSAAGLPPGVRPAGPQVPQIGLVTVRPPAGVALAGLLARLRRLPGVASVVREGRMVPRAMPDDPALTLPEPAHGVPAGVPLEWELTREAFPQAWDVTRGAGARVGIIDTGIDAAHPDFAGKIAATVDQDDIDPGPATVDETGHGTHVASLACAATDNGIGVAGAGWGCRIVMEKTDFTDASVAASIVDATDRGVQAINMSFGSDGARAPVPAIVRAIDYAVAHKVILVAAAADTVTIEQGDPANLLQPTRSGPKLDEGQGLSVTAADFSGRRASFAGLGTQISLAAFGAYSPGDGLLVPATGPPGVLGAFPTNTTSFESGLFPCHCRTSIGGDDRYGYLEGTSMAAPQVAAAAALVRTLNPDLSVQDVLVTLKQTALRPPGVGYTNDLGWGILDAGAAVQAAGLIDRHPPASRLRAPRRSATRRVRLRWTGSDAGPPGVVSSGIARYEVWAARDGGVARRVRTTSGTTTRYRCRAGHTYSFYTIAVDRAGNRERPPVHADARVRVLHRR